MSEIWKKAKGFESLFEVSNLGNVRTIDRLVRHSSNTGLMYLRKGKKIKPFDNGNGYLYVAISKKPRKNISVHELVGSTFLKKKLGYEINHKDKIRSNNRVDNLEYIKHIDNIKYSLCKKIVSVCQKTNKKKKYKSVGEAKKDGFNITSVSTALTTGRVYKDKKWVYG